jgi:hypothetical protein
MHALNRKFCNSEKPSDFFTYLSCFQDLDHSQGGDRTKDIGIPDDIGRSNDSRKLYVYEQL